MTDSEVMQDLFDTFEVTNRLNAIVHVENFLAGRHGLLEYARKADADPRHVLSCIQMIHKGIGPRLFGSFVMLDNVLPSEGLDDVWAHWCPLPEGVSLHAQDYPAGTMPLWSNGSATVFVRHTKDKHGNDVWDFGVK
jgi:hypothetical protein